MRTNVCIVGQGLAGSLLGWAFERAGISFRIIDRGPAGSASSVGAGILNPITGRRVVKSAMVDQLLPLAETTYRELEKHLGIPLLREYRLRRLFADRREREAALAKHARGELSPYVSEIDDYGMGVAPVFRLDISALVNGLNQRWRSLGSLTDGDGTAGSSSADLTVWCVGASELHADRFGFVPFRTSKGEIITVAASAIDPDVILNDRHWALPVEPGFAMIGATHQPDCENSECTSEGLTVLSAAARGLLGSIDEVVDHRCGIRITTTDKLPVAGRHIQDFSMGICNAIGSKGALWAPFLADAWVRHLAHKSRFPQEVDVARFSPKQACSSAVATDS